MDWNGTPTGIGCVCLYLVARNFHGTGGQIRIDSCVMLTFKLFDPRVGGTCGGLLCMCVRVILIVLIPVWFKTSKSKTCGAFLAALISELESFWGGKQEVKFSSLLLLYSQYLHCSQTLYTLAHAGSQHCQSVIVEPQAILSWCLLQWTHTRTYNCIRMEAQTKICWALWNAKVSHKCSLTYM